MYGRHVCEDKRYPEYLMVRDVCNCASVQLCRWCPTVQMGCDGAEGVQLCRWGVMVQRVSNCADGV